MRGKHKFMVRSLFGDILIWSNYFYHMNYVFVKCHKECERNGTGWVEKIEWEKINDDCQLGRQKVTFNVSWCVNNKH